MNDSYWQSLWWQWILISTASSVAFRGGKRAESFHSRWHNVFEKAFRHLEMFYRDEDRSGPRQIESTLPRNNGYRSCVPFSVNSKTHCCSLTNTTFQQRHRYHCSRSAFATFAMNSDDILFVFLKPWGHWIGHTDRIAKGQHCRADGSFGSESSHLNRGTLWSSMRTRSTRLWK